MQEILTVQEIAALKTVIMPVIQQKTQIVQKIVQKIQILTANNNAR